MTHSIRDTQNFLGNLTFPGLALPGLPSSQILGQEWQASITLAVSTTGNDTDPTRPSRIVSGDWSAKPFATIQAAIDALPRLGTETGRWDTDAVINVAAGTYPGFVVAGKHLDILIQAPLQAATLATGPNSGTATGGTASTLTLTGAGWTADDLIGKFLVVSSGPGASGYAKERIVKNTADTITVAGAALVRGAYGAGSVFTIEDHSVFLSGNAPALPPFLASSVLVLGCTGTVSIMGIACVASGQGGMGAYINQGQLYFAYCTSSNGSWAGFGSSQALTVWHDYCFSRNQSTSGFTGQTIVFLTWFGCAAVNCGDAGFSAALGIGWVYAQAGNHARNCVYGLFVGSNTATRAWSFAADGCGVGIEGENCALNCSDSDINGCTVRTFVLRQCRVILRGVHTGSGNAGFGLNAKGSGNVIELEGATPSVTGASGDATVDGVSPIVWADLAVVGDYAVDEATGARVMRA